MEELIRGGATTDDLAIKYGVSAKTITNRLGELRKRSRGTEQDKPVSAGPEMPKDAKETIDRNADGSYSSQKPLWMTLEQVKDDEYLLKAHGFEPDKWELVSARHSIWNTSDKVNGIQTLYGSRITVKPRASGWSFDKLLEAIKEVQPITIPVDSAPIRDKRMLEVPLFDAHFGVSNYDYYRPTQSRIYNLLTSRKWQETLFVIGSDMLHNDDMKGHTSNGTQIEVIDIPQAWNDCTIFYGVLIETALRQSKSVKVMYSPGNHDQSLSWCFVQMLKAKYPQVTFDDEMQERKIHTFGYNFIGITHGDKAKKQLHNIFPVEFPLEWSQATTRELHTGHYHVEDAKDTFGMMVRTLATRNKTDAWHRDNGFVGAHKRFQLFEYSEQELESIHYV
jgi:hypothetical protein